MNRLFIVSVIFAFVWGAHAQKSAPAASQLDQFAVGRHSFIDVGLPNDFYDVFLVKSSGRGSTIERISVTPAGDSCTEPPTTRVVSRTSTMSISELLGGIDPCAIPEKSLVRKSKRCKHCAVFSGVNVKLEAQCGARTRIIKSEILDDDLFSATPRTPEYTSWTMQLLTRLDGGAGPDVWNKPIFHTTSDKPSAGEKPDATLGGNLRSGKYDALFTNRDKFSDLYRLAESSPPYQGATVRLLSSTPVMPTDPTLPHYPPIARAARVSGTMTVNFLVNTKGETEDITFDEGPPMLRASVTEAITGWKFEVGDAGERVRATFDFDLNCVAKK